MAYTIAFPVRLIAGTSTSIETSVLQELEEAAKKVMRIIVGHKTKDVAEKAHTEQQCAPKEQEKQEHHKSQKADKSPSLEKEEEEFLGQGDVGDEGQTTPFIFKRCGKQ